MAHGQHKLSRRAVLAAACAGAAIPLPRHAGLDPASTFLPPLERNRWIPDQVRDDDAPEHVRDDAAPDPVRGDDAPDPVRGDDAPDLVRDDDGGRGARWRKALARYARAEAELEALAHVEDDDLYDRALGRHNAALARLLRAPAPDVAAAAGKLDLILRHQVFELTFGEACLAALGRDLRGFADFGGRSHS